LKNSTGSVLVFQKNQTEPGQFEPVLVFFFKNKFLFGYFVFIKNRTELKIITPNFNAFTRKRALRRWHKD
jgi:hypothetical protein